MMVSSLNSQVPGTNSFSSFFTVTRCNPLKASSEPPHLAGPLSSQGWLQLSSECDAVTQQLTQNYTKKFRQQKRKFKQSGFLLPCLGAVYVFSTSTDIQTSSFHSAHVKISDEQIGDVQCCFLLGCEIALLEDVWCILMFGIDQYQRHIIKDQLLQFLRKWPMFY